MSCQLLTYTQFHDIQSVKRYLFPNLDSPNENDIEMNNEEKEDTWADDWDWQVDGADGGEGDATAEDTHQSWLQNAMISLSPTNDLVAFAHIDRICLLTQKLDHQDPTESEPKYTLTWKGIITQEPGELITSVLCVPLASHKRSTQGGPDWTCTIAAFSSGFIRVYTETGSLLMSQLLHNEPVLSLKCRTYQAPRYLGLPEQQEELIILYKTSLVTVDGFSFYQSLRACRNQVARVAAGGTDMGVQAPPLAYKKWGLQGQEKVADHESCGIHTSCPFDQMVTASVLGGFSSHITPTPPAAACYLTTGTTPYLAFFYAIEGSSQPLLSEVAYAVASKLKSAFLSAASGWLNFASKPKDEQIKETTGLPMRFGLPDKRREGERIVLSPNNNYAAITDSFGRVLLVDVTRGVAVRMWKGYREAQVAWFETADGDSQAATRSTNRIAQFLIIYAPRRGIIEVWTAANGARVAAFNTSKSCLLLPVTHGIMGLNNVTIKSVKNRRLQCALVDPNGTIKTLDVPFHLALGDKNSKRSRDLHLLKKVKGMLKENNAESERLKSDLTSTLLDMKIASIIQQAIEKLLSTRYLGGEFMKCIIDAVISHLAHHNSADVDCRLLLQFCHHQEALLSTYISLTKFNYSAATHPVVIDNIIEHLSTNTSLPRADSELLVATVTAFSDHLQTCDQQRHVHFTEDDVRSPVAFLASFYCHLHRSSTASPHASPVNLARDIQHDRKLALGDMCYRACLEGRSDADGLIPILQSFSLPVDQLMELLLCTWLSRDQTTTYGLVNLHKIIKSLTAMTDSGNVIVDHTAVSPWWQTIRDTCSQSHRSCSALLMAVVCRNLASALSLQRSQPKDIDADADHTEQHEWESVSVETELWRTLVHQLEDTVAIERLLHTRPIPSPSGPHDDGANIGQMDSVKVSVNQLLHGGKGIMAELVAKHVVWCGLNADSLLPVIGTSSDSCQSPSNHASIIGELEAVRLRFPYSLDNNVLTANCCWEFAVQWNKDRDVTGNLTRCLDHLQLVDSSLVQQGLCSLLWQMFMSKPFAALALLMDKVGKMPKERLCRKEAGMSEKACGVFINCCRQLLYTIMDANCGVQTIPVLQLEPNWQQVRGPASLVELAIDQKSINYGLAQHHYRLSLAMCAVVQLSLRATKVFELFDNRGRQCFFTDLHSHPLLPSQKPSSDLSRPRMQFLHKILTYYVQATQTGEGTTNLLAWPKLVQELAHDFGLDPGDCKRHLVCELYRAGLDRRGEEVLSTVSNHEQMGQELLVIAGQRVSRFVYKTENVGMFEALTATSTSLSTWLRQRHLDKKDLNEVSLDDTLALTNHVLNELSESSDEYSLAVCLLDFLHTLTL